ncbi:MAG: LD-carboxypeptidase [Bdellovibrionales bacterium]|nr:LD-carboxypeptidase [Bdellovibrionales bacterium]
MSKFKEVGVFPASSPLSPNLKLEIEEFLHSQGVSVRYLSDPYENYGSTSFLFSARSAEDRLNSLKIEFQNSSSALLLAARGGSGAMEILEGLSSLPTPAAMKILCGFSDFTCLLPTLAKTPNVIALHGPTTLSFRNEVSLENKLASLQHLSSLLEGNTKLIEANEIEHLSGPIGEVEGELLGGNLSTFCSLLGTPFDPDSKGKILFFEEVGEAPHKVYRNLLHLKLAGKLSSARAILLGRFLNCEHPKQLGPNIRAIFSVIFDQSPIPVYLTDVFGHGDSTRTFPILYPARLSAQGLCLMNRLANPF